MILKQLFKALFRGKKDARNILPVVETSNGIPTHRSPYIAHRIEVGAEILSRCAAETPDRYTREEVWQSHPAFPLAACFNVHSLCNERCVMCPYRTTDGTRPTRVMDFQCFQKIWREFVGAGGRIATFNNFSDIFAHSVGMDYVRFALGHQDAVKTYFVTNGLALKKDYVDEILATGWNDILYLSCHGFSEGTFRHVTGVNGFRSVQENATYLARRHPKPENVIIQYATDFSGKDEIDAALTYWGDLGCTVNSFATHTFAGSSGHRDETVKEGRLAGCRGWGSDAGQPFYQAVIQQDGNLTLCCHDLEGTVVIGNTFREGLIAVWKSERMKNLIGRIYRGGGTTKELGLCRKCSLSQVV